MQKLSTIMETRFNVMACQVPREANMAAYSLAKWSMQNKFVGTFDYCNCPPCFGYIIKDEANVSQGQSQDSKSRGTNIIFLEHIF